jgi:hypothetical protein
VDLRYGYTKADFWVEQGLPRDDYTGHSPGISYLHRFTPHTLASISYNYSTFDFDGPTEDYDVHDGLVSIEHAFSPSFSVSGGIGYFYQDPEESDSEDGPRFEASVTKGFQRGVFTFGAAGGWDTSYLDAEGLGFLKFYSANAGVEYRILAPLGFYANAFYRHNEQPDTNRDWETITGIVGLTLEFWRYFALSLEYNYTKRDDDIDIEDYTANRVMLWLTASRLFRL